MKRSEEAIMRWPTDQRTAQVATAYPIPIKRDRPAPQDPGGMAYAETWKPRVMQPDAFPSRRFRASPAQVIKFFKDGHFTEALATVVRWGGMQRSPNLQSVYGHRTIEQINRTLRGCAESKFQLIVLSATKSGRRFAILSRSLSDPKTGKATASTLIADT